MAWMLMIRLSGLLSVDCKSSINGWVSGGLRVEDRKGLLVTKSPLYSGHLK